MLTNNFLLIFDVFGDDLWFLLVVKSINLLTGAVKEEINMTKPLIHHLIMTEIYDPIDLLTTL
jgi:hypothetical protein